MLKNGDIIYFKKAKKSSLRHAPEWAFKGHGAALLLAAMPPEYPDMPDEALFPLLGAIGLCTFDDIKIFLGEEAQKEFIRKFQERYYKPSLADIRPTAEPSSTLVDSSGKPLEAN